MRMTRRSWWLVAGAVSLAACGGNALGPDNQLEVTNTAGSFELHAVALDNISQTLTYGWQNGGTSANVNQSGGVTAGSATLIIYDPRGTQIYVSNLATTGTFQTASGFAGFWTIRIELHGVSGALDFRVETP
jgi:hypothetical protein